MTRKRKHNEVMALEEDPTLTKQIKYGSSSSTTATSTAMREKRQAIRTVTRFNSEFEVLIKTITKAYSYSPKYATDLVEELKRFLILVSYLNRPLQPSKQIEEALTQLKVAFSKEEYVCLTTCIPYLNNCNQTNNACNAEERQRLERSIYEYENFFDGNAIPKLFWDEFYYYNDFYYRYSYPTKQGKTAVRIKRLNTPPFLLYPAINERVCQLKLRIERFCKIPYDQQLLIVDARQLEDGDLVWQSYDVHKTNFIHLVDTKTYSLG